MSHFNSKLHNHLYFECLDKTNTWLYENLFAKLIYVTTMAFVLMPCVKVERVFYAVPKKLGYFSSDTFESGPAPVGFRRSAAISKLNDSEVEK